MTAVIFDAVLAVSPVVMILPVACVALFYTVIMRFAVVKYYGQDSFSMQSMLVMAAINLAAGLLSIYLMYPAAYSLAEGLQGGLIMAGVATVAVVAVLKAPVLPVGGIVDADDAAA